MEKDKIEQTDTNDIMNKFLALQDTLKEREAELTNYKSQIEDFKSKQDDYINQVASLRDTNQKLFLKVSQNQSDEGTVKTEALPQKEETVKSLDDLVSAML